MPPELLEREQQVSQREQIEDDNSWQDRIRAGLRESFAQVQSNIDRNFKTYNLIQTTINKIGQNGDIPPKTLTDLHQHNEEHTRRMIFEMKHLFAAMRANGVESAEIEKLENRVSQGKPDDLDLTPPAEPAAAPSGGPETPSLEAGPATPPQPEPAPFQTETVAPTEENAAPVEHQDAESTEFGEKKEAIAAGWDEQTDKEVYSILSGLFQEVQDQESYATFVVTRLDKRAHELIYKSKKLRTKIENATSNKELASIDETKRRLLTKLKEHLSTPSALRPSASEMTPVVDDTEIPDISSVSGKIEEADVDEEWDDDDTPYEPVPEVPVSAEQKRENYFNKFDQLYGDFQQVAMRAAPEARKNIDEIFTDFIAYENADPETIPLPLKQALLDAALEAYKTANNHEFSHAKFYSLSKDERESTGANTLNHIAGHLNLRGYLIEKTSLPPAKPRPQPKPKVKVTPKPAQAKSQPNPQPSAEIQPAAAPAPEVKPAEAAAATTAPEQTEAPINQELLKILDTLRETTGLTTLDQPEIKQLYKLFQTQGDPKTWHQGIKDEIVALTDEILFDAGIDPTPKLVWNEKIARLKTLDVSSALYRNKGIDQKDIEYLIKNQEQLQRKLLPDDNAALSTMNQLRQTMGMPEMQFARKISPADVEAMIAALARKVKREPKTEPVKPTTSAEQGSSFARKVAEQIIQTEQKEPQEAKAKTILKPDKAKIKATAENPFKVYRELVKNIAREIAGGRDADEALERAIDDYLRNPIRATRKEDLKKRLLAETPIVDAMAAKSQTS